jgi:hypothetical protein
MQKILKGAVVLLIPILLISTTVTSSADTMKNEKEVPVAFIAQRNTPDHKISPIPNPSGRAILWDNGLPDGRYSVSCVLWSTYQPPIDTEVVDDFIVDGDGWYVSDAHCRILIGMDFEPSALIAFKVFFYQNDGAECNPVIQQYEERDAQFNAYHTGDVYFSRREIAVDLDFEKVFLIPGRWWICIQPEINSKCYWLTAESKECPIFVSYPDFGAFKWTPGLDIFGDDFDVSFQITGVVKSKSLPLYLEFLEIQKTRSLLFKFLQQLF